MVRNVQLCVNHKDIFCKAFLSTSFFVNVSFFEKLFYHRPASNRQYIFFERVFKCRLIADVDFELKYSTIFIRKFHFTKEYSTGSIQTLENVKKVFASVYSLFWKMYSKFSIQMATFAKSIRQKVFKVEYFWGV